MKTGEKTQVTRDRETRYNTNGITLSFITWLAARLKVSNATIFDMAMDLLHKELLESMPDLPPVDVGEYDLDELIEKTDPQP